jgi:indolepyruvate ferredoxin oxidoreductase beta subunit
MKQNILIAGVGGQGNLFASALLAKSAIRRGYQVLATETIGAAQRGGSVVSHVRVADQALYSPLIPDGQADYLVGFEPIELLRHIRKLRQDGQYILNTHPVLTVGCTMGLDHYPTLSEIFDALNKMNVRGHMIHATEAADEIGDPLLMNMVMIGALCAVSAFFELDEIKALVAEGSRKALVEANLEALDAGAHLIGQATEGLLARPRVQTEVNDNAAGH